MAQRAARPCASRPPRASPGGPGEWGLAFPGWLLAGSPESRPRPRHAQPRRNPVQPRRSGTRAQEPAWRGPDVRWEGEAEDEGLGPRRTAARQSPQDIFPPQLCCPRPLFYSPWGSEEPGDPLEDTYDCENTAALGGTVSVQGPGLGRRRFSNSFKSTQYQAPPLLSISNTFKRTLEYTGRNKPGFPMSSRRFKLNPVAPRAREGQRRTIGDRLCG